MTNEGASSVGFFSNLFLSAIKLYAAMITGSLALLSDAVNSITDVMSSFSAWYAIRMSKEKADIKHPYGHYTAEPVAGLIIAIFAAVVGFEVIKSGVVEFFSPTIVSFSKLAVVIMVVSILVKGASVVYILRVKRGSPALDALAVDYRNDLVVTSVAVVGYLWGANTFGVADTIAALIVGLFILWSAFGISKENIDFLMGASPPVEVLERIRKKAESVRGVLTTNDLYAHYIGNRIHVEIHINIRDKHDTVKGHAISKRVQQAIEGIDIVDRAFVHIDPETHLNQK